MLQRLLNDAANRAYTYLAGARERRVTPSADEIEALKEFSRDLGEDPLDPARVLEELDRLGSPATVASAGGRYFGFVVGGTLPATLGANILAAAWDQNAGLESMSPVSAHLETVCQGWLNSLLGLPSTTAVGFVTGATMANFAGLAAARHSLLAARGWDAEARGLFGAPPITVVVGDEVHVTLLKALGLLGLGRDRIVRVPVDGEGRIIATRVPGIEGPTIVCLQAGNVNTGAFDPVENIAARLQGTGAWIHVDGAFGLWAAAAPGKRHWVRGIDKADSLAADAHKWLNVPYDSGLVFVRRPEFLNAAMSSSAAYLSTSEGRDPHRFVPELSRRARAVEIWAALRCLGKRGMAEMIERSCRHARRFADALRREGYQVLNDVVLNQVLVSFGAPECTLQVIDNIQQDGTCWCGATQWQGKTAMRISVCSWATTEDDVAKSIDAIVSAARAAKGPCAAGTRAPISAIDLDG
jgi:glutamate/tyrosine decarboxylase-like PLP-dependent enzyme